MNYDIKNARHIIINGYVIDTEGLIVVKEDGRLFEVRLDAKIRDAQDLEFLIQTRDSQTETSRLPFKIVTETGALCGSCLMHVSYGERRDTDAASIILSNTKYMAADLGLFWV